MSPNLAQLSSDVSDSDVAATVGVPMKSPRSVMLGEKLLNSIKHQTNLKSIPFLIRQGADLNVQDSDGKTALMYAVMNNDDETVKMIIESAGVDLNVQTRHGVTALMIAVADRKPTYVTLLLDAGADVSVEDKLQQSALSIALERGYDKIERMLRKYGAKTSLTPDQISYLQFMWNYMNRNKKPSDATSPRSAAEKSDAEVSEEDDVKPFIPDPIHDVILPSELEKQYEPLSILDKRSADDVVDRPATKRRRMSSSMFTPSYDMYAGDKYKMQQLFGENGWDMSSSAVSTSGPTSDDHVKTRKNKRGVRLDPTAPPDLSLWSYPVEQHPSDDDVRAAIRDYDYDEIIGGAKKRILEIERATNTRNLRLRRLFNGVVVNQKNG